MLRQGGGPVIFTLTFIGYTLGFPGMAVYDASKSGLIGLTRVLAAEFGAQGIRVNALLEKFAVFPFWTTGMPANHWQNYITPGRMP
ncbi:SDR family oxidoreductase [Dickeya dadantii]|uniref:SDR family oxidoreductase n=1 Tax=Dickeya dadantii TaxID=204038 RepID=UPI00301833E2